MVCEWMTVTVLVGFVSKSSSKPASTPAPAAPAAAPAVAAAAGAAKLLGITEGFGDFKSGYTDEGRVITLEYDTFYMVRGAAGSVSSASASGSGSAGGVTQKRIPVFSFLLQPPAFIFISATNDLNANATANASRVCVCACVRVRACDLVATAVHVARVDAHDLSSSSLRPMTCRC